MKFFYILTISLLLHLLLWLGLNAPTSNRAQNSHRPIEIEYKNSQQVKAPKSQKKIVVRESHPPSRLEEVLFNLKQKARYLSKKNQRVIKEQIAKKSGLTRNRTKQAKKNHDQKEAKKNSRKLSSRSRNDLISITRHSQLGDNIVISGSSTLGEHIPNVKQGGFTALNTDQFIFYTYYARINERIRHRWVDNVRDFINRTPLALLSQSSRSIQKTQIEVLLSKEGNYLETIIHKKSNFQHLDQAAVDAFAQAAPLPNPPLEMVGHDGKIHIHYSLYVVFDRKQLARARHR